MTKSMKQFHAYIVAFRALKRGAYQPSDIREVIRYQAGFSGAGARAAGSPVVDETREWERRLWRRLEPGDDVRGDHDSPLSYGTTERVSYVTTYDDYPPMR
jgi:hypothetical protein